jgi:D-alanyl-D-alanine carboxypeptidase
MRGMVFTATFNGANLVATDQKIITLNKQYQPEGIFKPEDVKKIVKIVTPPCSKPIITYDDMTYANIGQTTGLLDATYIPKNLTELSTTLGTRRGLCLTNNTIDAFEDLVEAAQKDGLIIKASSAFRSYDTQKILYETALNTTGTSTSISTAKPGYSEHQLGTTMDLTGSSNNYSSAADSFGGTPEDLWLKDNAYLYGFIQSYPSGKEDITGYKYEPWHYRYVGIKKAKEVHDSGLTLIEFL